MTEAGQFTPSWQTDVNFHCEVLCLISERIDSYSGLYITFCAPMMDGPEIKLPLVPLVLFFPISLSVSSL